MPSLALHLVTGRVLRSVNLAQVRVNIVQYQVLAVSRIQKLVAFFGRILLVYNSGIILHPTIIIQNSLECLRVHREVHGLLVLLLPLRHVEVLELLYPLIHLSLVGITDPRVVAWTAGVLGPLLRREDDTLTDRSTIVMAIKHLTAEDEVFDLVIALELLAIYVCLLHLKSSQIIVVSLAVIRLRRVLWSAQRSYFALSDSQ